MTTGATKIYEPLGSDNHTPDARAEAAGSLLKLAQTLRRGSVQANLLMTSEEVSGFRIIRDPDAADLRELKLELTALRGRLEELRIAGVSDSRDIQETEVGLNELARELSLQEPEIELLKDGFGWAADRIQENGFEARQRGELTFRLSQLAVSSAALWNIAQRVLTPLPN